MLSRPTRAERPACSPGRRVESVRHSSQAVERSAPVIRRGSSIGECPAFAPGRRKGSDRHTP